MRGMKLILLVYLAVYVGWAGYAYFTGAWAPASTSELALAIALLRGFVAEWIPATWPFVVVPCALYALALTVAVLWRLVADRRLGE